MTRRRSSWPRDNRGARSIHGRDDLRRTVLLSVLVAVLFGAIPGASYPLDTKHTAKAIFVDLKPRFEAMGFTVIGGDENGPKGSETVSFSLMSQSNEVNWWVGGLIVHNAKLAVDMWPNVSRSFGGQPFELEPGVKGLVKPDSYVGRAQFFRGLIHVNVSAERQGKTPVPAATIEEFARRVYQVLPGALGEIKPESKVELKLLDPNPICALRRPFRPLSPSELPGLSEQYLESISRGLTTERLGAAADGVSLLLVRAIVPEAGKVTFDLLDADAGGSLHDVLGRKWSAQYPFDDAGGMRLEVKAAPLNGSDTIAALALYKPPKDFGATPGARVFTLKADFKPTDKSKEKGTASVPLTLVRPPVVLMHGTYDNPTDCWAKISPGAPAGNTITMVDRLKQEAFRTFLVDYKEASGSYASTPSTFDANQATLWNAPGGIQEALEAFRNDKFAATRADVICHSLGGVLARVFIRGPLPDPKLYLFGSKYSAQELAREFDRLGKLVRNRSYQQGDVNRLVTISSTHRGSEVMELFDAYSKYSDSHWSPFSLWTEIFMGYVDLREQRITTGAPVDQVPGSEALRAVGPTRVRAHAISCISSDGDLDSYGGTYMGRAEKLWNASTAQSLEIGVGVHLRNKPAADRLVAAKAAEAALLAEIISLQEQQTRSAAKFSIPGLAQKVEERKAELAALKRKHALRFRTVVFRGENDCTVSRTSSSGGLKPPYQTTIAHVLHGFAPQYPSVQSRVIELLMSEGDRLFDPNGFPDTYAQKAGAPPTWGQLLVPPAPPGK